MTSPRLLLFSQQDVIEEILPDENPHAEESEFSEIILEPISEAEPNIIVMEPISNGAQEIIVPIVITTTQNTQGQHYQFLFYLCITPALIQALNEALELVASLLIKTDEETKENIWLIAIIGGIAFLTAAGLNGKAFLNSLDKLIASIREREMPEAWKNLTSRQKKFILSLMVPSVISTIFCMSFRAYYFFSHLTPGNQVFIDSIAIIGASLTAFLTRCLKSCENIIIHISRNTNWADYYYSVILLCAPLIAFDAIQEYINTFSILAELFNIDSAWPLAGLAASVFFAILTYSSFTGPFSLKKTNAFFQNFLNLFELDISQITTFLVSLALATLLVYFMQPLNLTLDKKFLLQYLNINPENPFVAYPLYISTWIVAMQNGIISCGSLYDPMKIFFQWIAEEVSIAYHFVENYFSHPTPTTQTTTISEELPVEEALDTTLTVNPEEENQETQPLRPQVNLSTSSHGFFSRRRERDDSAFCLRSLCTIS